MTDGHPASRLDELLPWNWQPICLELSHVQRMDAYVDRDESEECPYIF